MRSISEAARGRNDRYSPALASAGGRSAALRVTVSLPAAGPPSLVMGFTLHLDALRGAEVPPAEAPRWVSKLAPPPAAPRRARR